MTTSVGGPRSPEPVSRSDQILQKAVKMPGVKVAVKLFCKIFDLQPPESVTIRNLDKNQSKPLHKAGQSFKGNLPQSTATIVKEQQAEQQNLRNFFKIISNHIDPINIHTETDLGKLREFQNNLSDQGELGKQFADLKKHKTMFEFAGHEDLFKGLKNQVDQRIKYLEEKLSVGETFPSQSNGVKLTELKDKLDILMAETYVKFDPTTMQSASRKQIDVKRKAILEIKEKYVEYRNELAKGITGKEYENLTPREMEYVNKNIRMNASIADIERALDNLDRLLLTK